jgi:hypothetical protein
MYNSIDNTQKQRQYKMYEHIELTAYVGLFYFRTKDALKCKKLDLSCIIDHDHDGCFVVQTSTKF